MNRKHLLLLCLCIAASFTHPPSLCATPNIESWDNSMAAAKAASREARYDEAERGYREALKVAEQFGPMDVRLAQTLNELAATIRMVNRLEEAKSYLNRALAISEKTAKDHPEIASSLIGLAIVAATEGKQSDAEAYYKRALKIRRKAFGEKGPEVGRCLYSFGYFKLSQNELGPARSLLESALKIFELSPGDRPEYLALSLSALASLDARQDRAESATERYNRALHEIARVLPADHPLLAYINMDFADFKLFREDAAGAITLYDTALSTLVLRRENEEAIAHCKASLARAYAESERYVEAERLLAEAMPVLKAQPDADPEYMSNLRELQEWLTNRNSGNLPNYEVRYVNGVAFQIGTKDDVQVWLAAWKGKDLQTMVYVVNGSGRPFTFYPGDIKVEAVGPSQRELLKTYSAEEYEHKVENANMWRAIAAGMASLGNTPQPQTTSTSGQYQIRDNTGTTYGSYYGTITRWPTQADYQAANERTRARLEAMTTQLQASYEAISSSLMRNHTLDAHTYYGGTVFMKKKGDDYVISVPANGNSFQFSVKFSR